MNQLDLSSINERAPYQVSRLDKEGVYEFYTKHGIHYFVDFMEDDFVIMTADVTDEEGVTNYAAIIVPLETPNFEQIVSEFKNTITLFKNKPC